MQNNLRNIIFLQVKEFFTPACIEKFLEQSTYRFRKTWVNEVKGCVCSYVSDNRKYLTKPQQNAFGELSMILLKECRALPEVSSNELVDKYMHIVEHMNDGSLVHERQKLQNLADKLERKILHTISKEDKVLLEAFLKVACLYSNHKMVYEVDDKRVLLALLDL